MRIHAFEDPLDELPPLEIPGLNLWIMIEPSGLVWSWDGWQWN
tara:strand:- start:4 stop:132 length:129 start_codon:yes stop_codon:yes gene_type:complete